MQLSWLVYPGFIRDAGVDQLRRLPLYLQAAAKRLGSDRRPGSRRDLEARFHERTADLRPWQRLSPRVQHVRWALEELRVSLLAQELRAVGPISAQRVGKALDALASRALRGVGSATPSRSITKTSVRPTGGVRHRRGRRPARAGTTSLRRPPTFMPGMPCCQAPISCGSGNLADWPRSQEESNCSPVSKSTPT